jgi:hypothetical protein
MEELFSCFAAINLASQAEVLEEKKNIPENPV